MGTNWCLQILSLTLSKAIIISRCLYDTGGSYDTKKTNDTEDTTDTHDTQDAQDIQDTKDTKDSLQEISGPRGKIQFKQFLVWRNQRFGVRKKLILSFFWQSLYLKNNKWLLTAHES